MAPPSYAIPTQHGPGLLFPSMFPPMPPPPPPPPPYLLRNLRNSGFAWPVLPRIPRPQHSCRPKKIISICNPLTGEDVTEELLYSVNSKAKEKKPLNKVAPPLRHQRRLPPPISSPMPIPLGFLRKAPTPVIMKCVPDSDFFWPNEDRHWRNTNGIPFGGSCSWPPNIAPTLDESATNLTAPNNNFSRKRYQSVCTNKKNIVKYKRDVLLSLRDHPLAMIKPNGLPDLDIIKKEILQDNQLKGKCDKVCHNGTQTNVIPRNGITGKLPAKKPQSFRKPNLSSTPKKDINAEGHKSPKVIKSPISLDRGDSKDETEEVVEKITDVFKNLEIS